MRKFIDDEPDEVEVAGYEAIVELYKTQHETQQSAIEMFGTIAQALIAGWREHSKNSDDLAKQRLELEVERFRFEKEMKIREQENADLTRECVPAKDNAGLSKKTLASKSGTSAKPKAKPRSTKG